MSIILKVLQSEIFLVLISKIDFKSKFSLQNEVYIFQKKNKHDS